MEIYKIGEVISKGEGYIVFESNNVGNLIYVPDIEKFIVKKTMKLFVYKYKTEFLNTMYGFIDFQERILFDDLITVNGVGPKTAMGLLAQGKDLLLSLISNEEIDSLCSFPYLGLKTARQIIFELSDKYKKINKNKNSAHLFTIKDSLKKLGFQKHQIDYALKNIDMNGNIENLIEKSIRIISNEKFT